MAQTASKSRAVARPLTTIQRELADKLRLAETEARPYYEEAGALLLEAKAQVPERGWRKWLEQNFALSPKTADRYMTFCKRAREQEAKAESFGAQRRFRTLSEAVEPDRDPGHRPGWYQAAREEAQRIHARGATTARQVAHAKERGLVLQLAEQIITAGYRAVAGKLHPDHGGTAEQMSRLNRARDLLRHALH